MNIKDFIDREMKAKKFMFSELEQGSFLKEDDPVKEYILKDLSDEKHTTLKKEVVIKALEVYTWIYSNISKSPLEMEKDCPSHIKPYIKYINGLYKGKYFKEGLSTAKEKQVELSLSNKYI